jgi:hypothetical protein
MVFDRDDAANVFCPPAHEYCRLIGEGKTVSGRTRQRGNPIGVAARAVQGTRGKILTEHIGNGRGTTRAAGLQGSAVQRATLDVLPLKPRCVEAGFQTFAAVAQLGGRARENRTRLGAANRGADFGAFDLKHRGERPSIPAAEAAQIGWR